MSFKLVTVAIIVICILLANIYYGLVEYNVVDYTPGIYVVLAGAALVAGAALGVNTYQKKTSQLDPEEESLLREVKEGSTMGY